MALWGIVFGRMLHRHKDRTLALLPWIGLGMVAVALLVRGVGGPGNLRLPRDGSVIEFFNLIKYPPSLVFLLLFAGVNVLLMSAWNRIGDRMGRMGAVSYTHLDVYKRQTHACSRSLLGRHSQCAVQPDDFAIEHGILNDRLYQLCIF